ncbi:sorbitol related enzyme [Dorcoceras hygrometricum]|uniref:Sorbitol related enzyme n=1 Tax=Dorcoceras hygrometricum TaxID=472368 RepID=A0A2Z7ATW7_9LAMI|nr:sorbitol related enzyme [Dorcoceras hygrometricum]
MVRVLICTIWSQGSKLIRADGLIYSIWSRLQADLGKRAAGLAMKTFKVKSGVRNQAEAKLNQLEQKLRRVASWSWNDKAAGALSIDDVISSDITISRKIYQQRASTRCWCLKLAIAKRCRLHKLIRHRFAFSQDDVPVASYSAPSRRLQCFAYPVAGNPDAGKADVVKICKPVDKESNAKKQWK